MSTEEAIKKLLSLLKSCYEMSDSDIEAGMDLGELELDLPGLREDNKEMIAAFETIIPIVEPRLNTPEKIRAKVKELFPNNTEEELVAELLTQHEIMSGGKECSIVLPRSESYHLAYLNCKLLGSEQGEFSIDDDFEFIKRWNGEVIVLINGEAEVKFSEFPKEWQKEAVCTINTIL